MFQIPVAILAIVIAAGLIMALMVWKKKVGRRVFFATGIIVVSVSIALMIIRFYGLLFSIPILLLGLIYLITGLVRVQITWMRVIVVVIGVLVALLALWGVFMWGVSQQYALVALSAVFLFVGIALSIGALVWPAKWGRLR